MSAGKHTPGPWTFSREFSYDGIRFYIAQADGAPYTPHYSDVATLIAETVSDERKSIQEANARLIAAAPELLEALKAFVDNPGLTETERQKKARAAIAKVTGAQP